jgi:AAA+ ATPase superfamily predicted ATPase
MIQQFMDRKRELDFLEKCYREKTAFIVIYGRRRVGKQN